MPRQPKRLSDYFTQEEAQALVRATDSADTRLVLRLMFRCGLRVSAPTKTRRSTACRPEIRGTKAREQREILITDDLYGDQRATVPFAVGILE